MQYIFAENLCRLCKEKHISIEELADALDKSPRQINRYRNGQCTSISLDTLEKIAFKLDIPVSLLFSKQENCIS